MAISIAAPENRVSDGVISVAPFELADATTVMKWDADPDVLEGVLRSYGAFEKYEPLLGQRFDWAIYGRLRTD
jgi:hypothetical protein